MKKQSNTDEALQAVLANISNFDSTQLRKLNKVVVDRIKNLDAAQTMEQMTHFQVGEQVSFKDSSGTVMATVIRVNKKTVSVDTDDGKQYRVSPGLLHKRPPTVFSDDSTIAAGGRPDPLSSAPSLSLVTPPAGKSTADRPSPVTPISGRSDDEWVGGIVPMPGYITGEGEPYQPYATVWMDSLGFVLGMVPNKQENSVSMAVTDLIEVMQNPSSGKPLTPSRIRSADQELLSALEPHFPNIVFEYAQTPELDDLVTAMETDFPAGGEEQSWVSDLLEPQDVARFFESAANLYAAAPWSHVPFDDNLLCLNIPELGIENAVVSVIGQMGEHHGVVVFPDMQHYEQYAIAGDSIARESDLSFPPHAALCFDSGSDVSRELRKQISDNGWHVAGAHAYPEIITPDKNKMLRPVNLQDLQLFEVLATALPGFLNNATSLVKAWSGTGQASLDSKVDVGGKQFRVQLATPYPLIAHPDSADKNNLLMAKMARLAYTTQNEFDWDAHNVLTEQLREEFYASAEGADHLVDGIGACTLIMELASSYSSSTIATLMAGDLEEILYEIIPRKVAVSASDAAAIVAETRAFYAYMKRVYALEQATSCIAVLGEHAVEMLSAALSDGANFGMAKSVLQHGADSGFDMSSEAGLAAFMDSMQGQPLPASFNLPFDDEPPINIQHRPVDQKSRKKKRKASRKARKKNR